MKTMVEGFKLGFGAGFGLLAINLLLNLTMALVSFFWKP